MKNRPIVYAPRNIDAIPIRTGIFPAPKLAKDDPGHSPENPQPIPKITAPIMVLLLNVRSLFRNLPPRKGFVRILGIKLIVRAVTAAEPPSKISNPKSLSCKKLNTISCFDMPPKARPKPKSIPPVKTKNCRKFMELPPTFEPIALLLSQL